MKALLEKITSSKTILSNLPELTKVVMKNVETDVTISDALKYVKYIKDINTDHVFMETIPGVGGACFDYDVEGTEELVKRVFYGIIPEETVQNRVEEPMALAE